MFVVLLAAFPRRGNAIEDQVASVPLIQGHPRGVAIDSAGNRYVAGFFFGEVDFNPGPGLDARTSAGDADLFVTRFNADGSYAWTRTFGGALADSAAAVAISKNGLFVAGRFASADAGVPNAGGSDAIVLAFDSATGAPHSRFGNAGVQIFGGSGDDDAVALALGGKTLYVTGSFASTNATLGGNGLFSSKGDEDAFVLALNAGNGKPVARFGQSGVQTLAGLSVEHATGLAILGRKLFVCGWCFADGTGIGTLGPRTGLGGIDAFVMALDRTSGRAIRAFGETGLQLVGGSRDDPASGIVATPAALYLAGAFNSGDAGVGAIGQATSAGGDAFVLQLDAFSGGAFDFPATTFGGSDDDAAAALAVAGDTVLAVGSSFSFDASLGGGGALNAIGWNGFLLTVSRSANDVAGFTNEDTDGDDFPDEMEVALGTPPGEFILSPGGFDAGPADPLTVRSLTVRLDFTTPDPLRDTVRVRGTIPVAAGFVVAGQPVAISIGGVVRRFFLNPRGKAANSEGSFKLVVKRNKGGVPAQDASFSATFTGSSLRGQLDDEMLLGGATVPTPGEPRTVTTLLLVGNRFFRSDVMVDYTVVAGMSGLAVGP